MGAHSGRKPPTTEYRSAADIPQRGDSRLTHRVAFFIPTNTIKQYLSRTAAESEDYMEFFNSAVDVLQTLVIALGAGLGIWGVINLLEGYGNDNPGAKSQGMKQLMAGGGVALIGMVLVPLLSGLFG